MRNTFGWLLCGLILCLVPAETALAQGIDLSFLPTRAEATNYAETTRYEEVLAYLDILTATSDKLQQIYFGYTTEGRGLPLVIFGDVEEPTPAAVRATGKTRVFVLANIHAGEVAGKEAMLALMRAFAAEAHDAWTDSLVVLVAPIYNADGNERVSLYNRPRQHGPIGGMGQRPNAQDYDLNRDFMKLDAPETRSLLRVLNRFDPHVLVDLHTTNGTAHAYHLTYSPPLHPNTPAPLDQFLRARWLPAVTQSVKEKHGWDYYYYGNVPRRTDVPRGWYTFSHQPRFGTNYTGLRNRFAILSEAYSYANFDDRVQATRYFVEEILAFAYQHATRIRTLVEAADAASVVGEPLALRAQFARSEEPVEILLGAVEEERNPFTGEVMLLRTAEVQSEQMYEYGRFAGTESLAAPAAYLVPPTLTQVQDRLDAHGIRYEALARDQPMDIEAFRIDSTQRAERAFQGHYARTLFGTYEPSTRTLPAGTLVVPVAQPLGRLAFSLLEPRSDDGLAAWGMLDDAIAGQRYYPILRQPATE